MHISLDSALGRQRRLNSVGESVLQIAPNAAAAYSLRSLTGADPKVVRVRRDTDNAEQDFTASGVSSGALTSFTNADYAKYTSDFSSGDDSWGSFDDVTETGNIDGIGGLDNNLRLAIGTATSGHRAFRSSTLLVGQKINFSARVFVPSTNSDVDGILIRDANGTVIVATTAPTQDEWVTVTANDVTTVNAQLRVNLQKGAASSFTGNGSDEVYLREITVTQVTSDGFVETWYDQSGNSRHAVQSSAGSQPKIVNSGSLVSNGLDFDGSNDSIPIPSSIISNINSFSGFIVCKGRSGFAIDTALAISKGSGTTVRLGNNLFGSFNNQYSGGTTSLGSPDDAKHLVSLVVGDSNAESFLDSTSKGTISTASGYVADGAIGEAPGNNQYWQGQIEEIIIYDSDQGSNRVALETNIQTAYPTLP